jgi:hypothetical protein
VTESPCSFSIHSKRGPRSFLIPQAPKAPKDPPDGSETVRFPDESFKYQWSSRHDKTTYAQDIHVQVLYLGHALSAQALLLTLKMLVRQRTRPKKGD